MAGIQVAMGEDRAANLAHALAMVEEAAHRGAVLVVLPELFTGQYFPQYPARAEFLAWAEPIPGRTTAALSAAARHLGITLVGSVYERALPGLNYNTAVVVGPDGSLLGRTRKSHIPDGPGYTEKFYFAPGDSGYPVLDLAPGGVALPTATPTCWDQWFPEVARIAALQGAELIAYPTAIGSEPAYPDVDTHDAWRTVMRGHAIANCVCVLAVNRCGTEDAITFYGGTFLAGPMGEVLAELGPDEGILEAEIDLDAVDRARELSPFFRDRRTDTYGPLLSQGASRR